jgi:hypothetical protein
LLLDGADDTIQTRKVVTKGVEMRMEYSVTDMIQNLEDAGCDSDTITAFVDDMEKGKTAESIKLLNRHRQSLLDILHSDQRQIDCLDYLIYQIKKQR